MHNTQVKQFAILVLGLSVPFYVLGSLSPDGEEVIALPVSALAVVVPTAAAVIITRHHRESVRTLLMSGIEPPQDRPWLWATVGVGFMPAMVLVAHALWRPGGTDLAALSAAAVVGSIAVALLASYGEEVGWTAFATRRLLDRHSVFTTGLILAALWGVWHFIPFVQTNHSWSWIWWQTAFTVAFRVLITGLYALAGRSALVAVLAHASYNVAWSLLPSLWASYDPAVLAPITAVAGIAVAAFADWRRIRSRRRARHTMA